MTSSPSSPLERLVVPPEEQAHYIAKGKHARIQLLASRPHHVLKRLLPKRSAAAAARIELMRREAAMQQRARSVADQSLLVLPLPSTRVAVQVADSDADEEALLLPLLQPAVGLALERCQALLTGGGHESAFDASRPYLIDCQFGQYREAHQVCVRGSSTLLLGAQALRAVLGAEQYRELTRHVGRLVARALLQARLLCRDTELLLAAPLPDDAPRSSCCYVVYMIDFGMCELVGDGDELLPPPVDVAKQHVEALQTQFWPQYPLFHEHDNAMAAGFLDVAHTVYPEHDYEALRAFFAQNAIKSPPTFSDEEDAEGDEDEEDDDDDEDDDDEDEDEDDDDDGSIDLGSSDTSEDENDDEEEAEAASRRKRSRTAVDDSSSTKRQRHE